MKVLYQEYTIEQVIEYFVKGFEIKIASYTFFYDPQKGKIIFKLFIEEK